MPEAEKLVSHPALWRRRLMKVGSVLEPNYPRPRVVTVVTMQCLRAAIAKKTLQEKLFASQHEAKQSAKPENSDTGQ